LNMYIQNSVYSRAKVHETLIFGVPFFVITYFSAIVLTFSVN
jgi:hypothetical protein